MSEQNPSPTLHTERLILRPFAPADATELTQLAGTREVASTTLSIPHPYPPGVAVTWIAGHAESFEQGLGAHFAITRRIDAALVGAIGLRIEREHSRAELGYWIGVPFWGQGYGTEAARAVVRYGFEEANLHRIFAAHFSRNPSSGRVLQKIGMKHEGSRRQHLQKWGIFEDTEEYGMLRTDPWR